MPEQELEPLYDRLVVRRAVLSLAAAAGAVVAAVPAYELVSNYGGTLAAALTGWAATGWTAEHQLVGAGLLIALLSPLLVRLVEE